tara:strand:- start:309 stop:695 length:387 start_codon:yes stop_codon:yes gene_type:complete
MNEILDNLKFLDSHEWARMEDDGSVTVGISDHAQDLLGDIVFVELPELGSKFNQGEEVAIVESVKAASEVYCPVGGEILEVNYHLEDSPEIINSSPYGKGWFFKLKPVDITELDNLISPEEYSLNCEV